MASHWNTISENTKNSHQAAIDGLQKLSIDIKNQTKSFIQPSPVTPSDNLNPPSNDNKTNENWTNFSKAVELGVFSLTQSLQKVSDDVLKKTDELNRLAEENSKFAADQMTSRVCENWSAINLALDQAKLSTAKNLEELSVQIKSKTKELKDLADAHSCKVSNTMVC